MKTPRDNAETLLSKVEQLKRDLKAKDIELKTQQATIDRLNAQLALVIKECELKDSIIAKQRAKIGHLRGKG